MRRAIIIALFVLTTVGLVITSGVIPIKASSGHWAITTALLDFVKRRSVATHSFAIVEPALDNEALVQLGAAHYNTGCRPCHGSPIDAPPRVPAGMTPHPPDLKNQVTRWRARELFYIVLHGIKFTGMPAWPSPEREDEVWAVVAFLRALPQITPDRYSRMVLAESSTEPLEPVAHVARSQCAVCHGMDGLGLRGTNVPRLAGQRPEYMRLALEAYALGNRHSGMMTPVAAALAPEMRRELADYYARLGDAMPHADGDLVSRGAQLVVHGERTREVPACAECHGPATTARHEAYPLLAGQPASYLRLQLQLFRNGERGGSPHARIMRDIAPRLTDAQINDVTQHYGGLDVQP